jgi:hypothetical protein
MGFTRKNFVVAEAVRLPCVGRNAAHRPLCESMTRLAAFAFSFQP